MMSLYFFTSKYYICNICKKLYCMLLLVGIAILLCGCSNKNAVADAERTVIDFSISDENQFIADLDDIYSSCQDMKYKTEEEKLNQTRTVIESMGSKGYIAVDVENQINMANAKNAEMFLSEVAENRDAGCTILQVMYDKSFVRFDFKSGGNNVMITRRFYAWENNCFVEKNEENYKAYTWKYTDGYLFFERYRMGGYDGDSAYTALRVEPLDEKLRVLNRKYIKTIGYDSNNLFTTNWDESDMNRINYYDIYEAFYKMKYGMSSPYSDEGVTYMIEGKLYEKVFQEYLPVSADVLQHVNVYDVSRQMYQYRTRGMFDHSVTPLVPFPEVVDAEYNADGTITLIVNAVSEKDESGRLFTHKVAIKEKENDGFEYVSNDVLTMNKEGIYWYRDRLSDKEWQEYYGDTEKTITINQNGNVIDDSLLSDDEMENVKVNIIGILQSDAIRKLYEDEDISNNSDLIYDAVDILGSSGLICFADDTNMYNYQLFQSFYRNYTDGGGRDYICVYRVNRDASVTEMTFVYDDSRIQMIFNTAKFENHDWKFIATGIRDLKDMKLTQKGYFIYTYSNIIAHGGLKEYFRVSPLTDECRELTRKYVYGLSYVNYNMLVIDWDESNASDILVPCMFDDIYRLYTGENLKPDGGWIDADKYESVMLSMFPVTVTELRDNCDYNLEKDSYRYHVILGKQYPPFGEVVDYIYNDDGTVSLIVDAVWADKGSDIAFRNTLTVKQEEDGTFKYMSNHIEKVECDIPVYSD
jgi:PAS domain-containing protein